MATQGTDDADREAVLRSFLLGALPAERQEEIDKRFLADEELHGELQATADDLIHAYLAGELSAADRERFEAHFLASPRRREQVAFIRSLVSAVEHIETPAAAPATRWSRMSPMLPWAAVLVVGLAAGGWSIGEKRRSERSLAAALQRQEALQRQLAAQDERVRELEERVRGSSESGDIATWALRTRAARGEGVNSFPVRSAWVRLRVPLEDDFDVTSYRASLQTIEGREILRVGGLREVAGPEGRTLDVMVPTGLLRPGTFVLSLQRDVAGTSEELTATTFLVRH